ncbi:amino acid permease [Irpex lacteus]|nr:amino acid permease [Irpex lacteus]
MSEKQEKQAQETVVADNASLSSTLDDDRVLEEIGYVPSFKREFSNLATISFAFSIMGLCSSIATTFNTPLLVGGPSSVVWCWILGACMCFTLGASIAEIVSAFPTCGGLYTASAQLCPKRHRAIVGWVVGWLNILGQIAGASSTEFGLANMIWAAVVVAKDEAYTITAPKVVGVFIGLLVFHGMLVRRSKLPCTRWLARLTTGFVFINIGTTLLIIIVLLATTPRSECTQLPTYSAPMDCKPDRRVEQRNRVSLRTIECQWTMTDYDATAHISEEVRRAAYAAPSAIFIAVIGTGLLGWLLNIVVILCSGPLENLPGASQNAFLEIMALRMGKPGALFLWSFVCLTAFLSLLRTVYAFSRDHGLPTADTLATCRGGRRPAPCYLAHYFVSSSLVCWTWRVLLRERNLRFDGDGLDLSYIIPIFLRRFYRNHPEVEFKPGPFYMGDGLLGWAANVNCILWTLFVCVIFAMPNYLPVNPQNMNYASAITGGVIILSMIWYFISGRFHYKGPQSNLHEADKDHKLRSEDESRNALHHVDA